MILLVIFLLPSLRIVGVIVVVIVVVLVLISVVNGGAAKCSQIGENAGVYRH